MQLQQRELTIYIFSNKVIDECNQSVHKFSKEQFQRDFNQNTSILW